MLNECNLAHLALHDSALLPIIQCDPSKKCKLMMGWDGRLHFDYPRGCEGVHRLSASPPVKRANRDDNEDVAAVAGGLF